eukprot:jgi/Botrbrau1/15520/Bobra.0225s0009.1
MESKRKRRRTVDASTQDLPSSGMMESKQKRRRRTGDASTQDLPSSGAPPPCPGFPQWEDLPQHMQRHVLRSQGLSLRDLAKLAPNAKVFTDACQELYEAELKWLVGTTVSALGEELVGAALRFLCPSSTGAARDAVNSVDISDGEAMPGARGDDALLLVCRQIFGPTCAAFLVDRYFDIREGGALPADSELFSAGSVVVDAPATGLLADGQTSAVKWHFTNYFSFMCESEVPGVEIYVNKECYRFSWNLRNLWRNMPFKDPSKLIPFLGFQLLAWQKYEEGGQFGRSKGIFGKVPRRLLPTRKEVSGMPEEAQRAYSVLHMWAWRTWRKNVRK